MTDLFLVSGIDLEDQNLLVAADDPDAAAEFWRIYNDYHAGMRPRECLRVPPPTEFIALLKHYQMADALVRWQCMEMASKALGVEK